jgi:hypothetical protein
MLARSARQDGGGPALLPTFFAGTLAMVLAVVAIARIDNDWADLVAVAVLGAVTSALLLAVARRLRDDDGGENEGDR